MWFLVAMVTAEERAVCWSILIITDLIYLHPPDRSSLLVKLRQIIDDILG